MIAKIFYFIGLIPLIYEIWGAFNYKKIERFVETGKVSSHKEAVFVILNILYLLWSVAGLFTAKWLFFALLCCLSVITQIFRYKKDLPQWWFMYDHIISAILIFTMLTM